MRIWFGFLLALLAAFSLLPGMAGAAVTTLRQDGIGPLQLGMTRTAAVKTGWLSDRSAGCELASPRPVDYQLRGSKAPAGLRGSATFTKEKLTGVTVSRGARTALGIAPNRNSAAGMARVYRRAGYRVTSSFVPEFGGTFVTVSRGGEQRFSAFQTGTKIDSISVPYTPACE